MTFLYLGVDGATWDMIKPNLGKLPTFKRLLAEADCSTMHLKQKPWSASVWCSMFTGLTEQEHGHKDFVQDGVLRNRTHIKADFIWDLLDRAGKSVYVVNVPFIVPPFNYNTHFVGPGQGVPITDEENMQEIAAVEKKTKELLAKKPDVVIAVMTATDKMGHMHWGESILLDYYVEVDRALGALLKGQDQYLIMSDHGFCDYDKAPIQTLPKITKTGNELKGDHHPDAVVIKKNVPLTIEQPMDVFHGMKKMFKL